MALVFPSNPSVNDTYQVNGRTYVWNGTSWRTVKGGVPDVVPTLSVDNDFSAGGTLHIDSTNNEIGIGTAAPSHQLHLTQDLGVDGNLIVGGTITVPTPVAGTNDTKVATTAFVGDAVSTAVIGLLDGAPAALDTLNELAAALDDDASYAATITNALSLKLDSSSYTAADVLAKLLTVDGAGSSLDADTLDGSHASAFAPSVHTHSYLPLSGGTLTGHVTHGYNIATPANYWNGLQLEVQATSGTAGIGLHRSGYSHVGIYTDATNVLKFNMNSGTVTLNYNTGTIWGSGNDGSGSGLDADLLDGLHLHTGRNSEANKVVRTDGNGYIQAGWINTTSGNHTGSITRITASNDAYLRYVTPAHFRSQVTDGVYAAASHSHSGGMNYWDAGAGLAYSGASVGGGSANAIGFRWANPYVNCTVDNVISAAAANFSDKRLKTNITAYSDGISALRLLQPVTYSPLDIQSFDLSTGEPIVGDGEPGSTMLGFIADDVQEVVPSAVSGTGIQLKSIDTIQLVSVIVSALKDIDARLSALEAV